MKTPVLLFCTLSILVLTARAEQRGKSKTASGDIDSPRSSTLSLAEVTRLAIANNPMIDVAQARWEMMKHRVPQAAAWEDPMFGADVERMGTTSLTRYTDVEYMLSQKVPIGGKNRSRARAADAEALAALEELRRQQLDVAMRARTAYFRLLNAYAQLEVNRRNEALLQQFTEISRAKYEVGTQTQADVLLAETELIRLIEQRRDRERSLAEAQTQLNVVMNRPARAHLGQPVQVNLQHVTFGPARLETLALASRPELRRAEHRITAEEQRLEAARREWIPDLELRVEARRFREGGKGIQEYDTGVFFNIPWINQRKYRAQEREMANAVQMATSELEAARTETLGVVRDQLKRVETFHHHVELFRDRLLPVARKTVEATRISYETGKSGFLDLITAQRSLQDIEATYHQHLADHHIALAELEAIVAADLDLFPSPGLSAAKSVIPAESRQSTLAPRRASPRTRRSPK